MCIAFRVVILLGLPLPIFGISSSLCNDDLSKDICRLQSKHAIKHITKLKNPTVSIDLVYHDK